jgi:miniconductance mechanosensitive channel
VNDSNEIASFATGGVMLDPMVGLPALVLACLIADWVTRRVIVRSVRRVALRSANQLDDAMVKARFFTRVSHLAPLLLMYFGIQAIDVSDDTVAFVHRLVMALICLVAALLVGAFLDAAHEIYTSLPDVGRRPIKGYLGFVRILAYLVAGLLGVSILMERSPWVFLSGLGAMTAVLLLVFRDTILSLVASIQITSNKMIHVGDWIEMPQFGADGDVVDVALHTVTVQNWDKTLTTVPTHAFITGSFKNWRGMSDSESRRIKRSLHIDIESVRFLEPDEIVRLRAFVALEHYIDDKVNVIEAHNAKTSGDPAINANIRRLTNLGTFRAYILQYLSRHPNVHPDRTLIVRQLEAGAEGLPLEIYCFCNDIEWAHYESIQSDIFDHLIAIAPEFGLRIFQQPTGADVRRAVQDAASHE